MKKNSLILTIIISLASVYVWLFWGLHGEDFWFINSQLFFVVFSVWIVSLIDYIMLLKGEAGFNYAKILVGLTVNNYVDELFGKNTKLGGSEALTIIVWALWTVWVTYKHILMVIMKYLTSRKAKYLHNSRV